MNYSSEIISAYEAWQKAEDNIPEPHMKGYESRNKTARKKWRVFNDLCVKDGLQAVTVAHDLNPKTVPGKVSLIIKDTE